MTRRLPHVSKLVVTVTNGGSTFMLFSRKRAEGHGKHGRLECLGGRLNRKEDPLRALVRELHEEEVSGFLARRVLDERLCSETVSLTGAVYHTYRLSITFEEYLILEPGRHESLGFVLVPQALLRKRQMHEYLTEKTHELLTRLGILP